MEHYLECKALESSHREMEWKFHVSLQDIGIIMPVTVDSVDWIVQRFMRESLIIEKRRGWGLSDRHLRILVRRYIDKHWPCKPSIPEFITRTTRLVEEVKCDCMGTHKCELKNCWSTPPELLTILTQEFNLQVEGVPTRCT